MNLSKLALAAVLAATCGATAFAPSANAADGTITINGKVIDATCSINGGTANLTVTLPVVQTSALNSAAGETAGATPFTLTLTNCPTTPSGLKVAAFFSANNGSINTTSGNLLNQAAAPKAADVEVQLTNSDNSVIDLSQSDATSQNSEYDSIVAGSGTNDGTATLKYNAQYYSTGTSVTAGNVSTMVDYTLVYE